MPFGFGPWDLVLIVAVSIQATVLAYLRQPRLKTFTYFLPFPFTLAILSLGKPVDATNVLGMAVLMFYIQAVRILYNVVRLPIVVSIGLAALGYTAIGALMAPVVPHGGAAFWLALLAMLVLAIVLYFWMPHRQEPDHRTTLPVYIKMPIIAAVIVVLVSIKNTLGGFMTLFPMVGVVGAYEARRCLWTMGRGQPTWMLAMVPMMAILRLTQAPLGIGPALLLGWLAFLAVLLPLTLRQWRQADPAVRIPPSAGGDGEEPTGERRQMRSSNLSKGER
ncbi:MAG: hypothetical protein ACYC5O_20420 [Anaerolineae bacterium]